MVDLVTWRRFTVHHVCGRRKYSIVKRKGIDEKVLRESEEKSFVILGEVLKRTVNYRVYWSPYV